MLKIPTTSPHKLSAERVAKVTKALVRKLIEKGVLPPSAAEHEPPEPEPKREPFNGVLDCRPPSIYGAFGVIEGRKSDKATDKHG
jgi:hypothetical protein